MGTRTPGRDPGGAASRTACTATPSGGKFLLLQLFPGKYRQEEFRQLWLEGNSFLAPASNFLEPGARRLDPNHRFHEIRDV